MKKTAQIAMLLTAAFATPAGAAPTHGAMRSEVESLSRLTSPPASQPATGFDTDGTIKPIFFDGLDWRGKPTKVFAWIGLPDGASPSHPVSGVVLVHGGGGSAFKEWVEKWNSQGFAAISIAVEGQVERRNPGQSRKNRWQRHGHGGPARQGIYGDSDAPLHEQWMYHAVAAAILANSLIRSLPEVDPNKVGIMGVSWGGVITSTVIGIDPRFAFAIPTYGCGGLDQAPNKYGRALGDNELYKNVWDPNLRLANAKMPILWFSWPEDSHFPMDCLEASRAKSSGISIATLVPKMGHGHGSAWVRPEPYEFARSFLKDGKVWCAPASTNLDGDILTAAFETTRPLDSATLVSTTGTGDTAKRQWIESPASLESKDNRWTATAQIPPGTTACFINVKSGSLIATSRYIEKSN